MGSGRLFDRNSKFTSLHDLGVSVVDFHLGESATGQLMGPYHLPASSRHSIPTFPLILLGPSCASTIAEPLDTHELPDRTNTGFDREQQDSHWPYPPYQSQLCRVCSAAWPADLLGHHRKTVALRYLNCHNKDCSYRVIVPTLLFPCSHCVLVPYCFIVFWQVKALVAERNDARNSDLWKGRGLSSAAQSSK